MPLSERQKHIAKIVKECGPITGDKIAKNLNVTRAALRSDLAILVMGGILDSRTKVGYYFTGKKLGFFTEQIKKIIVKDVQSIPVVVSDTANAYDALVAMFTEDVGSLFVVEKQDILAGVLSRKDLLKASLTSQGQLDKLPVKMIMTPLSKMIVTYQDEPAIKAAQKIIDHEIDSLPVVQEIDKQKRKYKVVGRFTKTNITRIFLDLGVEKGGD